MRQGCTVRKGQIMQGLEDHVKNFGHFSKVNVEFLVSVMKKSYILKIFMCKRKNHQKYMPMYLIHMCICIDYLCKINSKLANVVAS